jgi:outer membrane protein assembly factor BamB
VKALEGLTRARSLVCAVVLVTLAGCSSVGSTLDKLNPFSSSSPKVKPAELQPIDASVTLKPLWQASLGSAGEFVFTPAVVGDSVYAASKEGTLARFDNGQQVWRISVGQVLSGGVGSDGLRVAVGTPKGEVLVFDAENGKELWRARASSEILAAPALGDDLVMVRSGDSRIFGFDKIDGKRKWVYQRSTPALSLRTNVGIVLGPRAVLAGFPGGKLVAVATNNGAALWEMTVALPKGSTELERMADVTSLPVLGGREVCTAVFQGRVSCVDLSTGNSIWAKELSSRAGLDVDDRFLYVSDDKGSVHALDRGTGASQWKQDKLFMRGLSRPLAIGKRVLVADAQGVIHILGREDGAFVGRATTDGSPIQADPQRISGGFLVQTRNGGLFAYAID